MSVSPMAVGQTLPILTVLLYTDGQVSGQAGQPYNLTGVLASQLSLNIYNVNSKTDQAGAGTFSIPNANSNVVQYQWVSADTATAGTYQVFVSLTISGNVLTFDPIPLTIVAK